MDEQLSFKQLSAYWVRKESFYPFHSIDWFCSNCFKKVHNKAVLRDFIYCPKCGFTILGVKDV